LNSLLAIDTATDACSLALQFGPELRVSHQVMPRRHQQELFALLNGLLEGQRVADIGLQAIAYGRGPGSFTGLRIAASFAQGLAFSLGLPALGVSTLELQARTLLRQQTLPDQCLLLSTIDARIGELYVACYHRDGEELAPLDTAQVCRPEAFALPEPQAARESLPLYLLGSGATALAERFEVAGSFPDALPEAQDMLPLVERALARGGLEGAADIHPDYVQHRSPWKKLAEQGRRP